MYYWLLAKGTSASPAQSCILFLLFCCKLMLLDSISKTDGDYKNVFLLALSIDWTKSISVLELTDAPFNAHRNSYGLAKLYMN